MTTQELIQEPDLNEYSLDGSGDVGLEETDLGSVEEPAAELTPEPTPDEVTTLREENARLTHESEQRQRETTEARLQNAAAEYAETRINHYRTQGVDEGTAHQLGVLEAREQLNAYRAQQAELRASRIDLSQQFGVPQEQLSGFGDEASMRHYAEQYSNTTGPQAKEIADMKKQIAQLTRGQVPAQDFNRPGGTGGTRVTSQNIDVLYSQGKVSDERYRRFIDSGT